MNVDALLKYGTLFGKGMMGTMAPGILQGALLGYFRTRNMTVAKLRKVVAENESLLVHIRADHRLKMKSLSPAMGKMDWMTINWAIGAVVDEFPGIASYFLGDEEAQKWLQRQIDEIKAEIGS